MVPDYYKILGIPPSATKEEIKRAYRSNAKIYHPDVNNSEDANHAFALLNEAYDILTDERKRNRFDLHYANPEGRKYNKPRGKMKDMRETHPILFHLLFLFGMFIGFILTIVSIAGTFLNLWPAVFVVIAIPGIILIVEGFKGIAGK